MYKRGLHNTPQNKEQRGLQYFFFVLQLKSWKYEYKWRDFQITKLTRILVDNGIKYSGKVLLKK